MTVEKIGKSTVFKVEKPEKKKQVKQEKPPAEYKQDKIKSQEAD